MGLLRHRSDGLLGQGVRGVHVIDAASWSAAVGDCGDALVAAGYADAARPEACTVQARGSSPVLRQELVVAVGWRKALSLVYLSLDDSDLCGRVLQ